MRPDPIPGANLAAIGEIEYQFDCAWSQVNCGPDISGHFAGKGNRRR